MSLISTLEVGSPVEGLYAVRDKERRLSRRGEPFLMLTLADASGAIRAFVFDEPDFFGSQFETGDRLRVAGQVVARDGRPAIRIRHLRPAPDEATAEHLLPRSHRDPEELFGFVLHLADEVADVALRRLLDTMTGDDALVKDWKTMPCSRSGHHAYQGGLIEHSVGVASLCQTLCQWHPRVDVDLLVTAGLVHDIGYTRTFRLAATFETTDEGRLLGHLALGSEILEGVAKRTGLSAERRLALLHAVGWHHGPPPGMSPGSASPEALALWRVNSLEAGVKARLEGPGIQDV
jgi:3'-5' exoribonuclease